MVGIGASAGGLEAFTQLLKHLPLDTGMAFVLVQHLDPGHESALTQILSRTTALPVLEITDGQVVQRDHVYVIPPNRDVDLQQGSLKLRTRESGRVPHRPIDSFFESLAADQRDRAIGVVLSGTASDGTLGLEAIKAEGGITFAQDDTAKHDSMPRSAVAAGCVDLVLPPADIARELARIANHPYVSAPSEVSPGGEDGSEALAHQDDGTPLPSGGSAPPGSDATQTRAEASRGRGKGDETSGAERQYQKILQILRDHSGVDFSFYKSTTIRRRINRRMLLTKQDTLENYARSLRGNSQELDALFSDALISVTSFFRGPGTFEVLQREVLPKLLSQRGDDPVRCWVLGCSTGQEAYSLAILFAEAAERSGSVRGLQIFATDLNDKLLEKARHGLYAKSITHDISPERLRRHFVEEEGGYRISKALREVVVFARQNLIADPPFSRMDLISCRNLLIYLEQALQKKALPTFHYALKPGGFLLLGASESIGEFGDLFETLDRKHRIYSRKPAPTSGFHLPVRNVRGDRAVPGHRATLPMLKPVDMEPAEGFRGELTAQREADRIAVSQFAPPSVLINDELQILQFRGPTGAYLEPPSGKASFDVLKMAREGLMLPLRAAIQQARDQNESACAENVRVSRDGETRQIRVEVIPLKNLRERCFLIVFVSAEADDVHALSPRSRDVPPLSGEQESKRIAELVSDLNETREYLQFLQEQHEAANEELQASNEEVQSANEELQSINEELETSKEELESANEELITVNEEMSHRNVDLSRLNDDLVNLQTSAGLAIVLLGLDLTIRRFSPQAGEQFNLQASDLGRPISHIRHNLFVSSEPAGPPGKTLVDIERRGAETIATVREQECDVQDQGGRWHSLRVHPYLTHDNKVDGAVLVLVDIDAVKFGEQEIRQKEEVLRESHAQLQLHANELARFNSIAIGRELRMIELKKEINEFCRRSGQDARYPLAFERDESTTDA